MATGNRPRRKPKPAPTHVTFEEGGYWITWGSHLNRVEMRKDYDNDKWNGRLDGCIHAIRFADGSEWDAINGWRRNKPGRDD